jgi:hypothetical protein
VSARTADAFFVAYICTELVSLLLFIQQSARSEFVLRKSLGAFFAVFLLAMWRSGSLFLFPQLSLLIATDSFAYQDCAGKTTCIIKGINENTVSVRCIFKIHKCIHTKTQVLSLLCEQLSSGFCSDGARGAERGANTKKKKERETNNVI